MNTPIISCKKATELIEKRNFIKLSAKEVVQLQMHKAICRGCRAYEKQSALLDGFLKKYICNSIPESVPQQINKELKQHIKLRLKLE